jgi:menaquinone-dependent protoporphyrinogen oxidase
MTARILIVYGSRNGQTEKIASYMSDLFTARGATTIVVSVDPEPNGVAMQDFDGVIVGSPVYYGRHLRSVAQFVRAHREALNAMTSAFYSVSGSAGSRDDVEQTAARTGVNEFLNEVGWQPSHSAIFGGAMAYTKYNVLMRWLIKRIAQKKGGPTDTSRDHEVTDWQRVRQFVETFLALAGHANAETSAVVGSSP